MFHLGGMSLGFFNPPPVKTEIKAKRVETKPATDDKRVREEDDRSADMERAFLTPWHLFY